MKCIGVHSIERSAQEDTLLVLFNTAVSNLVRYILLAHQLFSCFCSLGSLPEQFCP